VLDGNPEPDLVHATVCKQPTLKIRKMIDVLRLRDAFLTVQAKSYKKHANSVYRLPYTDCLLGLPSSLDDRGRILLRYVNYLLPNYKVS
jgi:hypothetical protein